MLGRAAGKRTASDPFYFSADDAKLQEAVSQAVDEIVASQVDDVKLLTEHQKRVLVEAIAYEVVKGNRAGPDNPVISSLYRADYRMTPVDVETFIMNEEYLGGMVGKNLRPVWLKDLIKIFAPDSKIYTWIITGCIGGGKTYAATLALVYKMYCMSCLHDPWKFHGIAPNTPIVYGCYSITKTQAADTGYSYVQSFIDHCPYFSAYFPRNMRIDSRIDFGPTTGKDLSVISGSQSLHVIGQNLFSLLIDEVNFMRSSISKQTGDVTGQAYKLYNDVESRMVSRFMTSKGTLPGLLMLVSSKHMQSSFLEEKMKKADPKTTLISDYSLWEAIPKHAETKTWFTVEIGDKFQTSRILKADEKPRVDAETVKVPEQFRRFFVADADQALRELAGKATFNVSPLIRDRQSIFRAIDAKLIHPFTKQSIVISTADQIYIENFYDVRRAFNPINSKWVPKLSPNAVRYIHGDLAVSGDAAGLAMGHIAGMKKSEVVRPDGTVSYEMYPHVVFDFMLQILPPEGAQIELAKIRRFIFFLNKLYKLAAVTFDGFQSTDMIQMLNAGGVPADKLSVDLSPEPYLSLRQGMFEDRVSYYQYPPFEREIGDVQYDVGIGKVDHPLHGADGAKGSKDVSDAAAGVMWHAITDMHSRVATIESQARGNSYTHTPVPNAGLVVAAPTKTGPQVLDWNAIRKAKETKR